MKKQLSFIPRSVSNKQQGKKRNTTTSKLRENTNTRQETIHGKQEVVGDVLTEIVNKIVSEPQTLIHPELCSQRGYINITEAIECQRNPPLVDVGPLSPKKMIPVYQRGRQAKEMQGTSSMKAEKCYTGLAWEPAPTPKNYGRVFEHHREKSNAFGYPREWEYTKTGRQYISQPSHRRGFDFTVMSYNVLAQNLLEDNLFLYERSPQHVLKWKYRQKRLLDELKYHTPDIICLQEVNVSHYHEFFKPQLHKLGYESEFIKRTADKLDGCATFYNRSKFTLEEAIPIEYNHRRGGNVLDRDNVALILKLIPISRSKSLPSNKRLCVSNTHLLFNPRRGDVKLAQLMVLLSELDKCGFLDDSSSPDMYHALIMCGDFNLVPQCDLYQFLLMGFLRYENLVCNFLSGQEEDQFGMPRAMYLRRDFFPTEMGINDNCQYCSVASSRQSRSRNKRKADNNDDNDIQITNLQRTGVLQHQIKLVSSYEHTIARLSHRHREVTTHHGRAACTVDYILYGIRSGLVRLQHGKVQMKDVKEGPLSLLGRYGLLASHELADMGSLPNSQLGSDHVSIMAKFRLN